MTANSIHDLLPWYVNDTLTPAEAESFRRHLADCEDCMKEVAFLETLQSELELHGEALLSDHPSPEKLVALLEPEAADESLPAEEAGELTRHLALCATCAEEARWVRRQARADESPGTPAPRPISLARRFWPLAAAAALLILALTVPLSGWLAPDALTTRVIRTHLIDNTVRAEGTVPEVKLALDAPNAFFFEVAVAPSALPARLEIVDAAGDAVLERDGIVAADLQGGSYLFVIGTRDDFPNGDYVARLSGSDGEPPTEYPFRVID